MLLSKRRYSVFWTGWGRVLFCLICTTLVASCATPEGTTSSTESQESTETVPTAQAWPGTCEESLEGSGCQRDLIIEYTRQVCDKNSVATACAAGVALQAESEGGDRARLEEYASVACAEGMARGCLLEAYFMLEGRTVGGYYESRETFRRHCSARQPGYCMAAGDSLLSAGAGSEEARPFLDRACQAGVAAGCRVLGNALRDEGKDGSDAFEKGCFAGDAASCKTLGDDTADFRDWALLPRIAMTRTDLMDAAREDCGAAKQPDCVLWGHIARRQMADDVADRVAKTLYDIGCQAGAADACFFYGMAVAQGFGGEPRPDDAERWREKGCSMGWTPACVAPSLHVE